MVLVSVAAGALGSLMPAGAAVTAGHPAGAHRLADARPGMLDPFARPALPAGQRYACPAPTRPGQMTCLAIVQAALSAASRTPGRAVFRGYGPADLRRAYRLRAAAARNGRGRTVAIVDAFSDPKAAADLARYRRLYHLPPCGTRSGCLRIVNEHGRAHPLPAADAGWAMEESLDLDMVSAICPRCRILLVEADFSTAFHLGTAVQTAAAMGARFISNSWGGPETLGQDASDHFYNHPGVVISFASGDDGYSTSYPAVLPFVTSVGGTSLRRARGGRGFTESVWGAIRIPDGTGSGCSATEPKPSWQRADATEPAGCLNRTENDVAAVADPDTGVVVIDSFRQPGRLIVGGTSAAAPIITSTYALAGMPTRNTYPAGYPYRHPHLFPVTSGANGQCEADRQYLCHGEPDYDGPTGLGTPDGTAAFTDHGTHRVTLTDPGTADARAGQKFSLTLTGLDTRPAPALRFTAAGLPPGLSIHAVPDSANARITGTLPGTPGTFTVTVTAADGPATGTTRFRIVALPSLATSGTAGPVKRPGGTLCLDGNGGGPGTAVTVRACHPGASQRWVYRSDGGPDGAGSLTIGGLCLSLPARLGPGVLVACDGSRGQQWRYARLGLLRNQRTGTCLAGGRAGAVTSAARCSLSRSRQLWRLPAGSVVSGAGGLCLDSQGNSATPTVAACSSTAGQRFRFAGGTFVSASGQCLTPRSRLAGAPVAFGICLPFPVELWFPVRGGQLINVMTGMCLTDPAAGGAGTALVLQNCYGEPGQVWGLN